MEGSQKKELTEKSSKNWGWKIFWKGLFGKHPLPLNKSCISNRVLVLPCLSQGTWEREFTTRGAGPIPAPALPSTSSSTPRPSSSLQIFCVYALRSWDLPCSGFSSIMKSVVCALQCGGRPVGSKWWHLTLVNLYLLVYKYFSQRKRKLTRATDRTCILGVFEDAICGTVLVLLLPEKQWLILKINHRIVFSIVSKTSHILLRK